MNSTRQAEKSLVMIAKEAPQNVSKFQLTMIPDVYSSILEENFIVETILFLHIHKSILTVCRILNSYDSKWRDTNQRSQLIQFISCSCIYCHSAQLRRLIWALSISLKPLYSCKFIPNFLILSRGLNYWTSNFLKMSVFLESKMR